LTIFFLAKEPEIEEKTIARTPTTNAPAVELQEEPFAPEGKFFCWLHKKVMLFTFFFFI